jgi:hypothetical protein
MSKIFSIAAVSILLSSAFTVSHTAVALDMSLYSPPPAYYDPARPYAAPLDYGEVGRTNTDYFTSSPFCPVDGANAYNGGFATLAYGGDSRPARYVCR